MKSKIRLFVFIPLASIFSLSVIFAQAPQKMSYQGVIRDINNTLIANQTVGMQLSILQASAMGGPVAVYVETQTPTTNINGLVSLEVGTGTVILGTFAAIDWARGPFYIKTETDPTGGTTYSITGTNELLSVPYTLYSANGVPSGTQAGEMLYWNGTIWTLIAPGSNGQTLTNCYGVPTWGICTPPVVGDYSQGGIVYYILQPTDPGYVLGETHGLICAPTSFSFSCGWGCNPTTITGADGSAIGTGNQNTIDILAECNVVGSAARVCSDLVLNGYNDWYLPSKDELNKLYINRAIAGSFTNSQYWTSTEYTLPPPTYAGAWAVSFLNGAITTWTKSTNNKVRAIRAF